MSILKEFLAGLILLIVAAVAIISCSFCVGALLLPFGVSEGAEQMAAGLLTIFAILVCWYIGHEVLSE